MLLTVLYPSLFGSSTSHRIRVVELHTTLLLTNGDVVS